MTRINRLVLLVLASLLLVAVAAPVLASDVEGASSGDTTDTTVAAEPVFEGDGPVVILPPAEDEAVDQPWTARFLIPLLVLSAIVLIVGVAIAYNRSIRRRYHVTA